MKHIKRYPTGKLIDCPMCDGKGFLVGEGCGQGRNKGVEFECMLCDGKKIIDAAIAQDYLIERIERLRSPVKEHRAIARIVPD